MKVSPLIAPPESFHAAPMTDVHWFWDFCTAAAWTVFYVDGQKIEHCPGKLGTSHARPDQAPIGVKDPVAWAQNEAIRKARARDNRYAAYILNRYRRGRMLITQDEMDEWRKYHQRAHDRRKRSDSGDLVDQAAAGDLRPIMGPMEYVECMRDGSE